MTILSISCQIVFSLMTNNPFMINQHWIRLWLGAVRQQAIAIASVDTDLCHHMVSPGHNELSWEIYIWVPHYADISNVCLWKKIRCHMAVIEPLFHDQPNITYILASQKIFSFDFNCTKVCGCNEQWSKYCYFGIKWLKFYIDLFSIFFSSCGWSWITPLWYKVMSFHHGFFTRDMEYIHWLFLINFMKMNQSINMDPFCCRYHHLR